MKYTQVKYMKKFRAINKGGKWRPVVQVEGGYRELSMQEVLHIVARANQEEYEKRELIKDGAVELILCNTL